MSVLSDCPPSTPAVECSDCLTGREKDLKGEESLRDNLGVLPGLGGSGVRNERGKEVGSGYHVSKVAMWGAFTESGNGTSSNYGEGHSELLQREEPIKESESGDDEQE